MADGNVLSGTDATTTRNRRPRRRPSLKQLRWALLLLGPLLVVLIGGYLYLTGGRYVSTDNAYVKAEKLTLTTDVAGIVAEVAVRENQQVAPGQILFRLDDEPFRLALAQADAELAAVRNDIEAQKANYREKQAELQLAEADVAFFEREHRRQAELAARRVAAEAQLDQARHNLDAARLRAASTRQELNAIVASLGGDPDIPVEAHPRYRAALAARDRAARDLRRTVVRAPFAGIVTNVPNLQPGMYLPASAPAFSLVATDHVWIEANPKETDLTNVRPGQKVTVTVDAYPGTTWHGTVESLSPASGAEFALLPAQNTTGNWVKVVQRIPVRIRLEPGPDMPTLRAGMSAEVEIDTGYQRALPTLIAQALAAVRR